MALIDVEDAGFSWGRRAGSPRAAFEHVSFSVSKGDLVAILGPSGCGKSSLLQCLAGLQPLSEGFVRIDAGPDVGRPLLLFQDAYLFPWLTVEDNVRSGRTLAGSLKRRPKDVTDILGSIGMWEHRSLYPRELSGGMKQRVALGRALANGASILLMDEPFSALDHLSRTRMGEFVLEVRKQYDITIAFVTHSIDEAIMLADKLLMMGGRPGTISEAIRVDLPRPRNLASDEFNVIRAHLVTALSHGERIVE